MYKRGVMEMIQEVKSGDKFNSLPKEFWMDDDSEKSLLPTDAPIFSIAISKCGNIYILGSDKKWAEFGCET